jgi:hypothetical protein
MYGDGINNLGCLVDVGKDLGVLEARVSRQRCCWLSVALAHGLVELNCLKHCP